jgi:ribosomal protein L20
MNRSRTLVIVLYNMALTYHLMGVRDANGEKKNLKRSMRYYRMAMDILGRNINIDRKKIMSLAVSNNMGNIYSHLFDSNKAQICLDRMAVALEAIYDSDTPEDMGDAYSFFHLNVVILFGQKEPAAPAA